MPPKAVSGVKPPGPLSIGSNIATDWKLFKQKWGHYSIITQLSGHENNYQVALFLHTIGEDALRIFNGFVFETEETARTVDEIIAKFDEFAIGEVNETYERYVFNSRVQRENEVFDSFLANIRLLAKTCGYCKDCDDSLLRDRIVLGVRDPATQKLLLRERKLTMKTAIDICRAAEDATKQGQAMNSSEATNSVNKVNFQKVELKLCLFCKKQHPFKKELCPAYGKTCNTCKNKNHFAGSVRCPERGTGVKQVMDGSAPENIYCISDDESSSVAAPTEFFIGSLKGAMSNETRAFALMLLVVGKNKTSVSFQIDPGSEVDTLCEKYVNASTIRPSSKVLKSWDGSITKAIGESSQIVVNPKNNKQYCLNFVVVPNDRSCLLGMKSCKMLNFVTINSNEFMVGSVGSLDELNLKKLYPTVFDGKLGTLEGKVTLRIQDGAIPKTLPARTMPFAVKEEVHCEIQRLVKLGVITSVDIPTQWVSQMAAARKPTGKLRICLDPAPLNQVLLREHYKLPTMEDILDKFSEATVFSKFDVENAYWHCELDYESSLLTTMATPWGRFRWLRLPFGLSVSGEIFQKKLCEAVSGIESVSPVADDIGLLGKGDLHHDMQVHVFMKRCEEKNIKLKFEKMKVKTSEMIFHGHVFTTKGMKPDHTKIEALRDMPAPTDVSGVLRFCGLAQYLARFMPNLSNIAAPLRLLTQKGVTWEWTEAQDSAFKEIKKLACESPLLAHYNPAESLVLQTDASSHSLGAALMQNGLPVAYASRSLTPTEQNYAQIEKECLSVVFGLERFDQYTFGRSVTVENDHKPLELILKKTLAATPKRLQAMRLRINRYAPDYIYKPGPKLFLADTLSRAYPDLSQPVGPTAGDFDKVNSLLYLPVTDKRMKEIYEMTEADESMQKLIQIIHDGWPETNNRVPEDLKPYYSVRDTLSYQDGIILKGERIVIPAKLRPDIKKTLHAAHLGKDSMLRRAREIVYWPGMNNELQQIAESCDICLKMAPKQCKEPLMPRDRGERPWQNVGCDLFEIDSRHYMVTVDYYSNFWELDFMSSTTSAAIILTLKRHFARYGVPEVFVSDCSPFESAEFKKFAGDYDFRHDTSSPGLSQSNGQAESSVKAAKKLIKKCAAEKSDPYKALLELRNTPMQGINLSPVQMLMQRRTRSMLPSTQKMLQPRVSDPRPAREQRTTSQKKYFDKHANPLPTLYVGQPVLFDKFDSTKRKAVWEKGVVSAHETAPRSYTIQGETGREFRRNRVHMMPNTSITQEPDNPHSTSETTIPEFVPEQLLPYDNPPQPEPISHDLPHDLVPPPVINSPRPSRSCGKPAYLTDYDCNQVFSVPQESHDQPYYIKC